MPLLVDTGVLYALADRRDAWHRRCVDLIDDELERLLVPVTVLPEITYLLHTRLGPAAERAFLKSLLDDELDVEPLKDADLRRVAAVLDRYPDVGLVDASVLAIAERLKLTRLATTDRRHFQALKPLHVASLDLAP